MELYVNIFSIGNLNSYPNLRISMNTYHTLLFQGFTYIFVNRYYQRNFSNVILSIWKIRGLIN